jgi:hypothetical protein
VDFVYILPSQRHTKDILLFIKHVGVRIPSPPGPPTECVLSYRGTVSLARETILNERLNHIRRMCPAAATQQMQLVQILRPTLEVRVLALSKSVEEMGLQTCSTLFLAPKDLLPEQLRILASPKASGYAAEDPPHDPAFLPSFLFDQTTRGQFCDLLITSPPMDDGSSQFGFILHKSVMSAIPYFASLFTSGMSEAAPKDGQMVKLVLPFAVTEFSFREFVFFAYFRDVIRLEKLAPAQLFQLLRLADYYGFEELVEQVQLAFDACRSYACLTAQTALDMLNTIQPLELEFKEDLQHIALTFAAFNFRDVAMLPAFRELPEDSEIYENIVEYVARAVWDEKLFVKYKSRVEKQDSSSHSES